MAHQATKTIGYSAVVARCVIEEIVENWNEVATGTCPIRQNAAFVKSPTTRFQKVTICSFCPAAIFSDVAFQLLNKFIWCHYVKTASK
jgi:hypothetical protein